MERNKRILKDRMIFPAGISKVYMIILSPSILRKGRKRKASAMDWIPG